MTSLPGRRRRNTLFALGAGLVAAVVVPTLIYVGANAISNSKAGRNALANAPLEQSFPETPTSMLATVSDTNELTSLTVFVLAPDGDESAAVYDQRGGSIVSVPINVDSGSGGQLLSLHDAYALGGQDELRADLESVINLTIDFSAVMKSDEFAAFLGSLPSIQVDLPTDVLGADETPLFTKGPNNLTSAQIAQILTSKSATQKERPRQANLDAVWSSIAAAIGSGREGLTLSAASPTTFAEMATRLMSGPVASRGLVARPLDSAVNPEGLDVEALDRPDTILVFASIAPAEMTRPAGGLTFRIEAPPGYDQQVRKTIGVLLSFGGNVVSVDLNAKSKAETKLLIYDASLAAVEPTENPIFGKITVETPDTRLGSIDETISLGTTYLKGVDLSAPDASSTSTPTSDAPTETTA
jgi:hypothetical protein